VNGTGEPLDRWVNDLAAVLYNAQQRVHLSRTSTGTPLNVRVAVRYEKRVKNMLTYPGISSSPEGRRMFPHFREITETFGD